MVCCVGVGAGGKDGFSNIFKGGWALYGFSQGRGGRARWLWDCWGCWDWWFEPEPPWWRRGSPVVPNFWVVAPIAFGPVGVSPTVVQSIFVVVPEMVSVVNGRVVVGPVRVSFTIRRTFLVRCPGPGVQ